MNNKKEILKEANETLGWLFDNYQDKGLSSIHLWGSIITPDFNPETSDIDAVALLSDDADFDELNKIRDWLPVKNPKLVRLQINFFYISELMKEKSVRSNLARLSSPEQAVYDFPYWQFVCGKLIEPTAFPAVSDEQFLYDQIVVVQERVEWAKNPKTPNDIQYYCKSLVWLCWAINKLSHSRSAFSWAVLKDEATSDTLPLISKLVELKESGWSRDLLKDKLAALVHDADYLIDIFFDGNE